MTPTNDLPTHLREIADGILFGRPSLVARQAADRLDQLERELAAVTAAIHKIHPTRRGSLVDMVEDLESHRETAMNAFRLSEKELAAERALSNEMAAQLEHASFACDPGGCQKMFVAWKEARRE
jgi:septal ring factor EnvC (AmiA/AmiB activator)